MTNLACVLDNCPKDGQFVNWLECRLCPFNPHGNFQPWREEVTCIHPQALHVPNPERWMSLRACGMVPSSSF